jgi:oxygen-independent coproporphyrinogen-3 oxidase
MTSQNVTEDSFSHEPATGNHFVSAYPPFSCWNSDATTAFKQALESPQENDDAPFGLYVHIPFCVHRCQYCYYLAYDGRLQEMAGYLTALNREFSIYMSTPAMAGRRLSFAYFGGGTPSLLSISQLGRLFGELQATVAWDTVEEVTFECAPRSVTEEKLRTLRAAGVTRLSMGVQQLDDKVLGSNGRAHAVSDVLRAYERIQRVGFDIVNIDLIVGLIGETEDTFLSSLDRIVGLSPDSVTIYQLEIPHNTPLFKAIREGTLKTAPADWPTKRDRLARGFAELEKAGYSVTSAYCAVRDPAKSRFMYQDAQYRGTDLLGIGVSSFSYLSGFHQQNQTQLGTYMDSLSAGELPLSRAYELEPGERLVREFVLQLKLGQVDVAALRSSYGIDPIERFSEPLEKFRSAGWLEIEPDRVALTRDGLLRADRMIPEFYLGKHRVERYS